MVTDDDVSLGMIVQLKCDNHGDEMAYSCRKENCVGGKEKEKFKLTTRLQF